MSPYSKPPSTTSTPSVLSGGARRKGIGSDIAKATPSKGKTSISQMQSNVDDQISEIQASAEDQRYKVAFLKNKHKKQELNVYLRKKDMKHKEAEAEKRNKEVEKAHQCEMEMAQLHIQKLREEGEVVRLKLQLAQLQSGLGTPSMSTSTNTTRF